MRYLVVLFLLTSCGVAQMASEPEIISGDSNNVSFRAGTYQNPGAAASNYCKNFSKKAVAIRSEPANATGTIFNYYFDCR